MRIKKNGERYFMDESIQRQAEIAREKGNCLLPTPPAMLLTHMQQALDQIDRYAPQWEHGDGYEVRLARLALLDLIRFLEGNR